MKALVIDDSKLYQQMFAAVLDGLGVEVTVVGSALAGFDALNESRYDLVCLGLHLPDIDGLEVCRLLRQQDGTRLSPIVLLTSNDEDGLQREAFEAGVTEVVRKAGLEDLHRSLRDFVARIRRSHSGRVLYVEDSPTTARLITHVLEKMALEVVHFESASRALEDFLSEDYDLVITDVLVEGDMSGVGLVRRIRGLGDHRRETPILAVSGLEDVARRVEILGLGANDYVSKPILEPEFVARVGNLIRTKQLFDQVRRQEAEMRELAITDQLTSLFNRRYLYEIAKKYIANADRHSEPLSLMLFDLDHFKAINDTHGHDGGDRVLAAVGALLRACSRDGDVAARYGGEELLVVMPRCTAAQACLKADELRRRIAELRPAGIPVTASIGVSACESGLGFDFESLFKQADEAVYAAKAGGRNRVELYDPKSTAVAPGEPPLSDVA